MAPSASVFEFWNYKLYLNKLLSGDENRKLTQTALAKAVRCQPAYLSRVLRGDAHLSSDQAYLASKYLGHAAEERRYFLHLILLNRATSPEIQSYYRTELQAILDDRLSLKKRVPLRQPLKGEQQAIYYGAWLHSAVHMCLTVPGLQQAGKIADYLGVKLEQARESLVFLGEIGVAQEKNGKYLLTQQQIHLDPKSHFINRHHTNWRLKALTQLERHRPEALHYSSVVSVAEMDLYGVQLVLTEAIEKVRAIVKDSPAEQVACYAIDFFTLKD